MFVESGFDPGRGRSSFAFGFRIRFTRMPGVKLKQFCTAHAAGTPAGVQFHSQINTGGVASLNPRLIAATPAGVQSFLPKFAQSPILFRRHRRITLLTAPENPIYFAIESE